MFTCSLVALNQKAPYYIVFIHLGPEIPAYTEIALEQAGLFNSNAEILLLAEEQAIKSTKISLKKVSVLPVETLVKSEAHNQFIKFSKLDKGYRDGFWYYTTERLFYLDDLMTQYDLYNVFHLENDNMLYTDLFTILPGFIASYPGIGAPYECDSRGFANFLYIRSKASMQALAKYLAEEAHLGESEMKLLLLFKENFGSSYIDHLPVIMPEYRQYYPLKRTNDSIPLDNNHSIYSKGFELFNSVFDGSIYGQYLGGIDPRNGSDGPGYINTAAFFNCSYMKFNWIEDELGRKVPYVGIGSKRYRINNLHIHSKNLSDFKSK